MTCGVLSDVGLRRQLNEDSYFASFPLFLVADGMGGHSAGDIASAAVVDSMSQNIALGSFTAAEELSQALAQTTRRLSDLGMEPGHPGSTMTGLVFSTHRGIPCTRVFNIGDSRTYILSEGEFSQVTEDHSEYQELKVSGQLTEKQVRDYPHRNVLTKALGAGFSPSIPIDQFIVPVMEGDRYIICSDGVCGDVTDALIEMAARNIEDPQELAQELISMSLRAGGKDNATVIVVDAHDVWPTWGSGAVSEETRTTEPVKADDTLPSERVVHLRALAQEVAIIQEESTSEGDK